MNIWGGTFDVPTKTQELNQLELEMSSATFWENTNTAKITVDRVSVLKNVVTPYAELGSSVDDFLTLAELIEEEGAESELMADADGEWAELTKALDDLELLSFLSGKYDSGDCFLSINAGAGGTESCDWADMLFRMYRRWAESKKFKISIVSIQEGDEAGIKNCTLMIQGPMAFGYLKAERGVHRLVRISPFDSNKRRHTSFTSIDVVPDIGDEAEVDIDDKDLRVDTFRASGAGGQHVNTTDSAVRITHIPTGIVVACQMERSQHKNRATAMKMLGAKLEELRQAEHAAEIDANSSVKTDIGWGHQIRSYVLHPYKMIKDLRTTYETSNTNNVLDGDLDPFIQAYLRSGLNKEDND
ncbi:peptide chain release factor 2 [Lentisphaera profundi]|uniref:Peptide chain release factor 2 n=1 Tax=Lentisphaera profundi TaxID=1658616 RepID=A0ABY7VVK4_9BACT|nr:peptide chain release factor 2 [Lentisphaera profundi]WDE98255.1 peptide chain release factor 2 [Lentisphaera profundi]